MVQWFSQYPSLGSLCSQEPRLDADRQTTPTYWIEAYFHDVSNFLKAKSTTKPKHKQTAYNALHALSQERSQTAWALKRMSVRGAQCPRLLEKSAIFQVFSLCSSERDFAADAGAFCPEQPLVSQGSTAFF
jgi:hypothetical protein